MPLDRTDPTAEALQAAIAGQYRLEKEIGRGGMGVVFLAVDEQLERRVAIKTLPPHLSQDVIVRERFIREARTAGALSHPGIVPIYSASERDGVVYFVMRWIDGESFADKLTATGTIAQQALVPLLRELADALGYAHSHGVVHRDIKAENVLLEKKTGRAIITDFGIARVAETQPMTATGTVLGTVHYMSPEQVTGEAIDGRTDLYALGVLAFRALAGKFPFERPTPSAVLVAHVNASPPRIAALVPGLHPTLERVVTRLLEKNPASRFASADALRTVLDTIAYDSAAAVPAVIETPRAPAIRSDAPRAVVGSPAVGSSSVGIAEREYVAPDRISSEDAQHIWARAAELQANTGLMARPVELSPAVKQELLTVGYDVSLVRSSALDAGIDARFIERAIAERVRPPVAIVAGEMMQQKPGLFTGARTRIGFEASIDGELTPEGFEELADECRRAIGEMVNVSAVGRTMTITTAATGGVGRRSHVPRSLQITVTSRHGRTTVHGFENLQSLSGQMFGGIMGGVGGGGGGMVMGLVMGATQNPAIAFPLWLTVIASSYGGARLLFARSSRNREEELRRIIERVITRAREFVG